MTHLIQKIRATWNQMYRTVGQDQWPCDVLLGLMLELQGTCNSRYTTALLKKETGALLHLTIGDEAKNVMCEALTAIYALRASRRGKRKVV